MQCPECQHGNRQGAKFCEECGAKLLSICPNCGSEISNPQAKFCDECGNRLDVEAPRAVALLTPTEAAAPKLEDMQGQLQEFIPDALARKYLAAEQQATGENRLITALFADISGFTPFSATQSSEAIFEMVQECFKQLVSVVANYEGTISGFRGDGLLALFGAPILHENDAERAILAALDMRSSMQEQQLGVSIGINTALMTVGEIQTQLHREYTAYGADINLAKRFQEAAKSGQILVGAGTYRPTRRAFDFEVLPPLLLKGFSEPVIAYSVQQVKARPEKVRGIEGLRARMIGREREFAEIKRAADDLISGRGSIVSVIGEGGLGKSRLASELEGYLKDKDAIWFEGRSISIGQTVSYCPFLDMLRTYLNLSDADSESDAARKLRGSITNLFPHRWGDILPFLGHLLSIKFGDELDNRLAYFTPEQIRHHTMMHLRDVFIAISHRKPLLLILEDLHWSDDLSLDLVSLLMDELAANPLMLLCIYRPERDHRCWQIGDLASRKCPERYTEITLKSLSAAQSRQLVESLLEIENLPERTRDMILKKSEGNPFFIEEVIRFLIERDLVYREDDRWKARREIEDIDVPDSIQSVLLSRVDRLEPGAKHVLQCASVIGSSFRYRLLEHLTQYQMDLEEHLTQLEERDLVYEDRTIPELEYAFKHVFTQEATYQGIVGRRRKEFHKHVADGIEDLYRERIEEFYEELAHHNRFGGNDEKAIEYIIKSGHKARRLYNNATAIDYYTDALDLLSIHEVLGRNVHYQEVYEGLGDVHRVTSEFDEALKSYEEAKQFCAIPESKAAIYRKTGNIYEKKGNYDTSKEQYELGLAELKVHPDSVELPRLYNGIGFIHYRRGEYSEAIKMCEQALEMLGKGDDYVTIAETYKNLAIAKYFMGNAEEAFADMDLSVGMAERANNRMLLARLYNTKATMCELSGDLDYTIQTFQRILGMRIELGDIDGQAVTKNSLGGVYRIKGEYDKAITCLEDSLKLAQRVENVRCVADAYNNLGVVYWCMKEFDRAIEYFQESREIQKDINYVRGIAVCTGNIAEVYTEKGDLEEAEKYHLEAIRIAKQISDREVECYQYQGLGEVYLAKENCGAALGHLERALALAEELNNREAMGDACKGICQVHQRTDRLEEAQTYFDQAANHYAEIGAEAKLKELQELKATWLRL